MEGDQTTQSETRPPEGGHHGGTPESLTLFDYGAVGISVVLVAMTFYLAIKYLIWPGEQSAGHIKRSILDEEAGEHG